MDLQHVQKMGTPLELVSYNGKSGKFEVGQAAMKALRGVKGPVGVVAVCGRARQGKSFILNQLLSETSGGFVVGPTHRPCTKGLWMWSSPQKRTGKDGTAHHLVRVHIVQLLLMINGATSQDLSVVNLFLLI